VPPTPVRPARRTPRRRTAEPSKRVQTPTPLPAGRRREDRLVEHVSSSNSAVVLSSRALQRHPWCCGSTGRQDITTPATIRLPTLRQRNPRADVRTTTKPGAPTPLPSKPLLDGHRTRRDVLPEARFARTANHSVVLYTIPSHVIRCSTTVSRLPLAYKRRDGPLAAEGERRAAHLHIFRLRHDIGTGPGGTTSSPAMLVAPLCKHHSAAQYSASSTSLLDVRPRPELG
jgi:hypothetical protein